MPDKYPDGEGPVDLDEAKKRAKAEHAKPEHAYKRQNGDHDPRDRADYDLDDPKHQEKP